MEKNYVNFGHSSKLIYDNPYGTNGESEYRTFYRQSTGPLINKLDTNRIYNKNQCFTAYGPISSYMGNGVSTVKGQPPAASQQLTDMESILTNRNVLLSKSYKSNLNPINVTKFKNKDLGECTNILDPVSSRLTHPAFNYKEIPISRFYNLNQNPQNVIFWNFEVNTKNEARDNFTFTFENNKSFDTPSLTSF